MEALCVSDTHSLDCDTSKVTCIVRRMNTFGTDCTGNVDLGMFSQIADGTDDFDWKFHNAGTLSSGTGPSSDHTGNSGCYAYIEASRNTANPVFEGARVIAVSECCCSCGPLGWFAMLGCLLLSCLLGGCPL